jgi:hypothetical protein
MANNLGIAIRNEFLKFLAPITGVKIEGFGLSSLVRLVGHNNALGLDSQLKTEVERIAGLIEDVAKIRDEELSSWEGIVHVLLIADDVIEAVVKLDSTIESLPANAKDLGKELVEKLLTIYLRSHRPNLFHIASFCTIVTPSELSEPIPMEVENGVLKRLTQFNDQIHFERISVVFSNLANLLKETYLPNNMESGENAHRGAESLFYHLRKITRHWDLSGREEIVRVAPEPLPPVDDVVNDDDDDDDWDIGGDDSEDNEYSPPDLTEYYKNYSPRFSVFSPSVIGPDGSHSSVGLTITASSAEHPDGVKGFIISPQGNLAWENTLNGWALNLTVNGSLPEFVIGPNGITGVQDTQARAQFTALSPSLNSNELFHFGAPEGTRVDIPGFQFLVDLKLDEHPELIVSVESKQSTLFVPPSDGFLQSIFPENGLQIPFDLGLGWSSKSGFFIIGSSGLTAVIPLHLSLGPLKINTISLDLDVDEHGLRNVIAASTEVKIGPIQATIGGIGLSVKCDFKKEADGNFGPLDFELGFTPPSKIGLTIDTGMVIGGGFLTGGGFLELDPSNNSYAGVMALKLAFGKRDIGLTAIGLITTPLPNGEKGFSMLVSINTYFTPAIPLAFGFKLNAAGGLIGIHRTMKVDVLRERIQNGASKSIMFPENVTTNASRIISDLRTVFHPQKKHYVAAPFFKIGYGKPTILEADLGILLELPFKGRLILLGTLGIYLPNKDAKKRLGEIHVDIFWDVNIADSYMLIEGRLRDSEIVKVSLTGGFAFMLDWGGNPQFLLSVGGYHPRYKKPASFPEIPRVTALIKRGEDIRLSCEYYQAITSNSFQIGFSAELVVKKGRAKAHGFLGFNGFLQFDPFYFETDIRISVEVSYRGRTFFGVELEFMLSGPEPWRARGYAKIKILFFKLKIKFNISWGDEQKAVPVFINPDVLLEKLKIDLQQPGNWSAKLSAGYNGAESLRSIEESEKQDLVLIHPSGYLELRQNLIPLNKIIEKFGNSKLEAGTSYHISDYTFGQGEPVDARTQKPFLDYFSRGQFEELPDKEKLSTPDFDLMTAGFEVTPDEAYDISQDIQFTDNDFEDIILGKTGTSRQKNSFSWQEERIMNLGGGRKPVNVARPEEQFGVMEEVPVQKERSYKILSKESLDPPAGIKGKYFNSYSGAKDFLKTNWAKEQQRAWQVLQVEPEELEEVLIM